MNLWLAVALAYLAGSIPTSLWAGLIGRGIDLRQHGSGNLGATNTFRVLGWRYAVPVGAVDIAKGWLPVWALSPRVGPAPWIPLVIGAAAVVGHVFSVFAGWRGGKGVATAAGVVLGLAPVALLGALGVWIAVLALTGFVSLASVSAALAFPLFAWWWESGQSYVVPAGAALAAFLTYNHRTNLRRLLAGTEPKVGRRMR